MECPTCNDSGYLVDQTYGEANIPDGWVPVQACDACSPELSDDEAVRLAAAQHFTKFAWFDADDPELFGDWAIFLPLYAQL